MRGIENREEQLGFRDVTSSKAGTTKLTGILEYLEGIGPVRHCIAGCKGKRFLRRRTLEETYYWENLGEEWDVDVEDS